ncbi:MAG: hypothetical protein E6H48_16535 [Betaproteobacteria bacterium]|nr:MAG: hypothetical protein E6H48_16535 [Betaproteobacteria bacterium]
MFALSGASAAASALPALAAVPERRSKLHVVIVGAGLACLVSAYELEKRGHRVTSSRRLRHIGGRVRTLRFADGHYGEAGAMRIPKRHGLTRRYIAQFGLPLRSFVHSNDKAYYFARASDDGSRTSRRYLLGINCATTTHRQLARRLLVTRGHEGGSGPLGRRAPRIACGHSDQRKPAGVRSPELVAALGRRRFITGSDRISRGDQRRRDIAGV